MFKSRRKGFTLAEVLVTIAIVAIIAAAVVPAVTSQINKGEETTVTSAVTTVRTGLTTFLSDVRSFPRSVSQMTTAIVAGTDSSLSGTGYTAAQAARWKGPYSTLATFAANDSIPIGLGLFLGDTLRDQSNFIVASIHLHAANDAAAKALAFRLESLFESTADSLTGTVRWAGVGSTKRVRVFLTSSR